MKGAYMKKTKHNWQVATGRVVVVNKDRPDDTVEAMDNPDTLQQRRQHEMERRAYIAETSIPELVDKANTAAGTEERKRLKKLSEFRTKPVSFASINYSNKAWQRPSKNPVRGDMGGVTCTPSSKTDIKINSYYSSKGRVPK